MGNFERGLRKFGDFSGRDNTVHFRSYVVPVFVVSIILTAVIFGEDLSEYVMGSEQQGYYSDSSEIFWLVFRAAIFGFIVPLVLTASAFVRRMHDLGFRGLWLLIALVVGVSFAPIWVAIIVIFATKKGNEGSNKFGEPES